MRSVRDSYLSVINLDNEYLLQSARPAAASSTTIAARCLRRGPRSAYMVSYESAFRKSGSQLRNAYA